MNILVIGSLYQNFVSLIKNSKKDFKLFLASNDISTDMPNIKYDSVNELVQKAKILQIDIAINLDKNLIIENINEAFKSNRINLISVNKKWLNLEFSRLTAKKLMEYYSINFPKVISIPLSFPVIMKSDFPELTLKISSKEELINNLKQYENTKTFFEEYLEGERHSLVSLWDKKNLYLLNPPQNITEVQKDRFDLMKTKLNFMLSDENADFTGFFTTNLIWAKNDWYVDEFEMGVVNGGVNEGVNINTLLRQDILYILESATYQKLNELE